MRDAAQNANATPVEIVNELENALTVYIRKRREMLFGKFFSSAKERHQGLVPETRAALRELQQLEEALFGTKI